MRVSKVIFLAITLFLGYFCCAQTPDTAAGPQPRDTTKVSARDSGHRQAPVKRDSLQSSHASNTAAAHQLPVAQPERLSDSVMRQADLDTGLIAPVISEPKSNVLEKALMQNKFIDAAATPQFHVIEIRNWRNGKEVFFYAMCVLLLILGIFKTFYSHYFSTLFSVYFNTSLRQTQLSEQLLQARLPSFILNIYFILMAGIFIWLLFLNAHTTAPASPFLLLQLCLIAVAAIYLIKFCFLKFIGWLSGIYDVTNHYIFIIFLVNKLLAIVLIPFVILIAFGNKEWMNIYITLALLCVGALIMSRYIKSYGLLRQRFPMTPFHFLLFFLGAELIPLLIMYKVAADYLIA